MGKKKRKELEKQKQRFVEGAFSNGINKDIAAGIFKDRAICRIWI